MKNLYKILEHNCKPMFKKDLIQLLNKLNINKGDTVILHVSLNAFGYLIGGEVTLIDTIIQCLGEEGTLVMPAQSVEIMDPQFWEYPAVPTEWHEQIRASIEPYNKKNTPVGRGLGIVARYFCNREGVKRSNHPLYSFCAYGKRTEEILKDHPLDYGLGKMSPLGKLYGLDAKVLMLGTDFESNTSIHLAEYELGRGDIFEVAPLLIDGKKQWVKFKNVELDVYDDFIEFQESFINKYKDSILIEEMHNGRAMSFQMVECVNYARDYYLSKENS